MINLKRSILFLSNLKTSWLVAAGTLMPLLQTKFSSIPKYKGCIFSDSGMMVNPSLKRSKLIDSIILIALIYELNRACSLHMHLMNKSLSSNNKGNILFKTWIAPLILAMSSSFWITLTFVAKSCIIFIEWDTIWITLSILLSFIFLKSSRPTVVNTFEKSSEAIKNLSSCEECSRVKNSFWNIFNLSLYSY